MKIVVCVKGTAWSEEEIGFTADERAVDPELLAFELSEWDLCAIEAALQLGDGEVVVVSVGDENADGPLRCALAMGAGRAIRLDAGVQLADSLAVAALLAPIVAAEQPQLVLCGAQSPDAGNGATGGALAGLLGWPCAVVASQLSVSHGHATARRALEGGATSVVELELPAVVTVQTGFYRSRHPTLKALGRADAAPLDVRSADPPAASCVVRRMFRPAPEHAARMLDGELADVTAAVAGLIAGRVA